jgi:CubicO group peptidase (beta-lactamase class C family)
MLKKWLWLVLGLLVALPTAAQDNIAFETQTIDVFQISISVPEGWAELGTGAYSPDGGKTILVQQMNIGITPSQLLGAMLPSLLLKEVPEPVGSQETTALMWDIYKLDIQAPPPVGNITLDMAIAAGDNRTYLILFQTAPENYEQYHEAVFLPVVAAFTPIAPIPTVTPAPTETPAPDATLAPVAYNDPDGRFRIPLPTGWTIEKLEDYGILQSPNDEVIVYALAMETDDLEAALVDAWALVGDIGADLTYTDAEMQVFDDPALTGGTEKIIVITYEDGTGENQRIVQGLAQLYDNTTYILLFDTTVTAAQARASQISIVSTGFQILELGEEDLSSEDPVVVNPAIIADLEAFINAAMPDLLVPGAAVAIVQNGEIVYSNSFGVKELNGTDPVLPDTHMMIGSTTKSMTTMLMGAIVDEGLMTWDTPVIEILPDFAVQDAELSQTITIANLVCACTGVPRRDFELVFNTNDLTAENIIESLQTFEFLTNFGEAFQYSNQLVATGGYAAAAAAGIEYGDLYNGYVALMQNRIFDPIGMSNTTFDFETVIERNNYAIPHGSTLTEYLPIDVDTERFVTPIAPAGAVWSTVGDLAQYLLTELNNGTAPDGTQVISAENLQRTWTPQVAVSATASYGLGWFVDEYKGVQVIHHGGNTFGFSSDLAFMPEKNIGIVVLVNQQGSSLPGLIRQRLWELVFEQTDETSAQAALIKQTTDEALAQFAGGLSGELDDAVVTPFVGTYQNDALGSATITLTDDNHLLLDVGEFQTEIWLATHPTTGDTKYLFYNPPLSGLEIKFTSADDASTTFTIGVGVVEYTFTLVEE